MFGGDSLLADTRCSKTGQFLSRGGREEPCGIDLLEAFELHRGTSRKSHHGFLPSYLGKRVGIRLACDANGSHPVEGSEYAALCALLSKLFGP